MSPPPGAYNTHPRQYNTHDTGVDDSGTINIYFEKEAPIQKFDAAAPKVHVGPATGEVQRSTQYPARFSLHRTCNAFF